MFQELLQDAVTLFVIIDPIGNVPIFLALTRHLDPGATLLAAPPPIFLAIFHGDRGVSEQAVYLYLALKKAAVPPELHEWGDGGHDYCIHPSTTPHTT